MPQLKPDLQNTLLFLNRPNLLSITLTVLGLLIAWFTLPGLISHKPSLSGSFPYEQPLFSGDAEEAYLSGEYRTAAGLFRLQTLSAENDSIADAARIGIIRSHIALGDFKSATVLIEAALNESHLLDNPSGQVYVRCLKSEVLIRSGNLKGGLPSSRLCLEGAIANEQIEPRTKYFALHVAGFAAQELDRFGDALGYYEKALGVLERHDGADSEMYANTLNNMANVWYGIGLYDLSLSNHIETLRLRRSIYPDIHPKIAGSLGNLGLTYQALSRHGKAVNYIREALMIWTHVFGTNHPQTAYSLNNYGQALINLGLHREAESQLLRAIDIKERVLSKTSTSTARSYKNLAQAYLGTDNVLLARRAIEKAVSILDNRAYEAGMLWVHTLDVWADVEKRDHEMPRALALRHRALDLAQGLDHPFAITLANDLSQDYLNSRRYDKADHYARLSLKLNSVIADVLESNYGFRHRSRMNPLAYSKSRYLLASITFEQFDVSRSPESLHLARMQVRESILVISSLRGGHPDGEYKSTVDLLFEDAASLGLKIAFAGEQLDDSDMYSEFAFFIVETMKRDPSSLRLTQVNQNASGNTINAFTSERDSLRSSLISQARSLFILNNEPLSNQSVRQRVQTSLLATRRRFMAVQDSLSRLATDQRFLDPEDIKVKPIRRALLDKSTVYLHYYVDGDHIYIVSLSDTDARIDRLPYDPMLKALVVSYGKSISARRTRDFVTQSRALYGRIVSPVERLTGRKSLIVSPDQDLWSVPFETLLYEDSFGNREITDFSSLPYLIHRNVITYSISATETMLWRGDRDPSSYDKKLLAVGPVFDFDHTMTPAVREFLTAHEYPIFERTSLPELPGSRQEITNIKLIVGDSGPLRRLLRRDGTHSLIGEQATEEHLKKALRSTSYRSIHIATHGFASPGRPDFTGVILSPSPDSDEDGILYSSEIMHLPLNTRLVVLSSCNTGIADYRRNSMDGFIRNVTYAGAENIVASMWPSDDVGTSLLMTKFYSYLQKELSISEALRQAKRFVINEGGIISEPYFWATFVHVGADIEGRRYSLSDYSLE